MKKTKIIFLLAIIVIIGYFLFPAFLNKELFASYVGSKNSNMYHKLTCPLVKDIKDKDKIWFDATILKEGTRYNGKQYFPCNKCNP
jgi:hypothetical protein